MPSRLIAGLGPQGYGAVPRMTVALQPASSLLERTRGLRGPSAVGIGMCRVLGCGARVGGSARREPLRTQPNGALKRGSNAARPNRAASAVLRRNRAATPPPPPVRVFAWVGRVMSGAT